MECISLTFPPNHPLCPDQQGDVMRLLTRLYDGAAPGWPCWQPPVPAWRGYWQTLASYWQILASYWHASSSKKDKPLPAWTPHFSVMTPGGCVSGHGTQTTIGHIHLFPGAACSTPLTWRAQLIHATRQINDHRSENLRRSAMLGIALHSCARQAAGPGLARLVAPLPSPRSLTLHRVRVA